MISHEKKFIFIHIPRTGGSRLSEFLLPYCDEESLRFSPFGDKSHLHATMIEYVNYYGKKILDYTLFTICRNPWERVLSQAIHHYGAFNRESFRQIVFEPHRASIFPHSHFNYLFNEKAQSYLPDPLHEGDVPKISYALKIHTDEAMETFNEWVYWPYFLQFEEYTQDVAFMFDKLGVKYDLEKLKKKTNSSTHRHYSAYFEDDEIEEVRLACGIDIQFLGYEFEKENI